MHSISLGNKWNGLSSEMISSPPRESFYDSSTRWGFSFPCNGFISHLTVLSTLSVSCSFFPRGAHSVFSFSRIDSHSESERGGVETISKMTYNSCSVQSSWSNYLEELMNGFKKPLHWLQWLMFLEMHLEATCIPTTRVPAKHAKSHGKGLEICIKKNNF